MGLARYEREMGQRPACVVVHKTSRYWPGELDGFRSVLADSVRRFDLLATAPEQRPAHHHDALLPGASYNFAFERVAGSFGVRFADRLIRFAAALAVFAACWA